MENDILYFVLGILSGAVPVTIIFLTIMRIRKKRETGPERDSRHSRKKTLSEQLKSVEQERLEEKLEEEGGNKKLNRKRPVKTPVKPKVKRP